jgi:diguanylate cyclase (GGDEF)-like protein
LSNPVTSFLAALRHRAYICGPSGRIKARGLLPLVGVLPVVIYAYAAQAVVVGKTEARARAMIVRDVKNLQRRAERVQDSDFANCRDYAHWDGMYSRMPALDPHWLKANIETGIATDAFGFSTVLLQDSSGRVVWSKGIHGSALDDVRHYRVLAKAMNGEGCRGFIVLDRRVYSFASESIRLSNHTGMPKGMLLVARQVTSQYLKDLTIGTEDSLSFCQASNQVSGLGNLGQISKIPQPILDVMDGRKTLSNIAVETSTDSKTAYGVLPIVDINGVTIGDIINMTSRANVLTTIQTIRQFSIFLMVLCAIVGIAGVSYFKNRALAQRANRDELTGLYNHGYMQEQLKHHVELAERYSRPLAVMLVDIDHFKYVNDSHGHAVGDLVLKSMGQLIVDTIRSTDVAARYGGEEFAVLLPETDIVQALAGAERLRSAIERMVVKTRALEKSGSGGLKLTASIGVGVYPDDGMSPCDLLQAADAALIEGKSTRNIVRAFREVIKTHETSLNRLPMLDAFLRDSSMSAIRPLVAAIDTRDPGSVRHSEKTAEYALAIGRELQFSTQELALACKASLLHDVGMIGVPFHLLTKTTALDQDEVDTIKRHCKIGADILSQSPQLVGAADAVLRHHERYDGQGYPGRLAGQDIPLIARVVAVADSIDAMMSPRSYKQALTLEQALDEIRNMSGVQFDPYVVQAAGKVLSKMIEDQANGQVKAA